MHDRAWISMRMHAGIYTIHSTQFGDWMRQRTLSRDHTSDCLTLKRQDVLAWYEPKGQNKNTDPDTDPMGPICKQKMEYWHHL